MLWECRPRGDGRADILTEQGQLIALSRDEDVAWDLTKRHNRQEHEAAVAEHRDASRDAGA